MGTPHIRTLIEKTKLFPLVDHNAFDAFIEDKDKEFLRPLLFPLKDHATDLPLGIRMLWELLHCSDKDLGTLFFDGSNNQDATYFNHEDDEGKKVTRFLGSGSQGLVYATESPDTVVKSSVVGELRYIERELYALKALAASVDKCIPQLKGVGRIEYKIRDSAVKVPALLISPQGISASQYLSKVVGEEMKSKELISFWKNGLDALDFAHGKKVFHLDVCPRNFIFYENRYILVDWGCASFSGEKVRGFRGSLPFAHAEVHSKSNKTEWAPENKHDRAPLVFTVCALYVDNSVPWSGFDSRRGRSDPVFTARRKLTKEKVGHLLKEYRNGNSTTSTTEMEMYGMNFKTDRFSNLQRKINSEISDD